MKKRNEQPFGVLRLYSISPNKSSGNPGGQMPNVSDCFFMPEDKKSQNLTGNPIKSRTKVSTKQRNSGKILHTVARFGMEATNNHVKGGEELRESEQILMAMGAAGKKGMFISMPDYRTDKIKDGKPIYREIVFPVTKEFREKLYGEFDKEYEKEKQKGEDSQDKESDRVAEKNKAKKDKDPEKEKKVAQTR